MSPEPVLFPSDDDRLRAATSFLTERLQWAHRMGITFDGKRDIYQIFGYKQDLTAADYRLRYERGGIAGRIVDAIAKATWRGGVELVEDEQTSEVSTEFEQAWAALEDRLHVTAKLQAVDILSRLSTFAVLLIGAPGDVTQPLERGNGPDGVLFLKPFCGVGGPDAYNRPRTFGAALEGTATADAVIDKLDADPLSARFGLPTGYRLRRTDFGATSDFSTKVVHWSRVVHVAEDGLDDEVYAPPCLERVWNYLDDLDKVVGGGSEAFFQRANQGRIWNIDKDAKLGEPERQIMRDEIEKFQHNQIRDVRTHGVSVESLGSDVANFSNQEDAILTLIAGACGIPKRILTGSEMGELASSQDRDNWRDQVNGRRQQYAGPCVLRRLVDRLVEFGYSPKPKQYQPRWGSVMNLTEEERSTKAASWASTNAALKGAGQPPAFLVNEIRDQCYEMGPYDLAKLAEEMALVQSVAPAAPEPVERFPRAASAADEALVERLAAAIEANDTAAIDEIVGGAHG